MCRVKFPKRQNSIETQALLLQSFLGKYDKPPTCKVSHWPFIPTGGLVNFSVTFTLCRLVSIKHGGVIIFSCFSCFFLVFGFFGFFLNQKRYCKHWEGGEAYEIPRLPDGS